MTDEEIIDYIGNPISCDEKCDGRKSGKCKLKYFVGKCYAEMLKEKLKGNGNENQKFN